MSIKRSYIRFFKYFLPVLFISYMAGITFFTHSHVVNGVTIVHSHPFDKDIEHGHTTTEFQLIYQLSHVLTSGEIFFPFIIVFLALYVCVLRDKKFIAKYISPLKGAISLRAPPVYC